MDYSLVGSSVRGIFQARILEWVAISFSRGSSRPRDRTWVSSTAGRLFTVWANEKIKTHWGLLPWQFSDWDSAPEAEGTGLIPGRGRKLSTKELMLLNCGVGEDSESPLDCKEIQPVHHKGDQSWVFIGRTEVEAETLPNAKSWLIWKDPDAGKD